MPLEFLNAKGEMAQRCQKFDWTSTCLGDPESWDQSLKTSVGIILRTAFPAFIAWGPQRVLIHNDGYLPMLGDKRQATALGRSFYHVWPEVWPDLEPLMIEVDIGESRYFENLKLVTSRSGTPQDSYFTFSYSPLITTDGRVGGLFCNCIETTQQMKTVQNLEKTEVELVGILETMDEAFFSVDKNFVITRVNSNHEQATEVSRTQQIGKNLLELFFSRQEDQASKYWSAYHEAMKERVHVTFEDYYPALDLWTAVNVYPQDDGGLAVFFRKINDQKKAQDELLKAKEEAERAKDEVALEAKRADRERAMLEASFQSVAEGIFIFDSDGNPVFMNDAAAKVFGENNAADVRERFEFYFERLDLYDFDDKLIPLSDWPVAKALRGESFRDWQIKVHRRDTNDRWIWSSSGGLAQQPGKDITLGVVVLRDITEEKKAELELKAAKAEAERANQTKSFFLANMSHEIRTPLGAILGYTDLLKDSSLSSSDREQFLDTISRNGKGLTRIIDDILDLAKVESGKLEVEKIDFSFFDLLDEVIDLFRERTKAKGLYVRMHMDEKIPTRICSDPTRLRQIFINLIGNAVKFTEVGGVTIHVFATPQRGRLTQFRVEIRDTGLGIPEDQRARLFQPFSQADNTTSRKYGGTGLVLVLSERLAKALGGHIEVADSGTGQGSKFTVSFIAETSHHPAVTPTATATASPSISATSAARTPSQNPTATDLPLQNIRILIADDSVDNLALVTCILKNYGAMVETASNGAKACKAALESDFDLVLMDIQMPEMDGHQATRALREAGFQKPILALTAHAMAEERALTLASGCNGHLTKPINPALLVAEIRRAVHLV